MKIGQSVKVNLGGVDVKGNQIPEQWTRGAVINVFTDSYKIGFGEFSSYTEEYFPHDFVVRYTPLSEEAQRAIITRDLPIGLELANDLIKQFLPGRPECTIDGDSLVGYKGGITIDPVTSDQKTIGGLIEKLEWEVISWTWEGGGRWHPDEKVDSAVGTYRSIGEAVSAMIQSIFKMEIDGYLDAKAEQAMAEQWRLDEA